MDKRLRAPATARNREPILGVMRRVFPARARVLEIASGSGEHAVFIAKAMPQWIWRPSDPDAAARESIAAWSEAEAVSSVLPPIEIDVRAPAWGVESDAPYDALVAINMIHIAPWASALGLMAGAARVLASGGILFLYGPFKRDGRHTAPSNESFDASLRARDPSWGVRDLADVESAAIPHGLVLDEIVDMPANNLSLVFRRHAM